MPPSRDGDIGGVPHEVAGDREAAAEDVPDSGVGGAGTTSKTNQDQGPTVDPLPKWQLSAKKMGVIHFFMYQLTSEKKYKKLHLILYYRI